jgi:hypothetical protein
MPSPPTWLNDFAVFNVVRNREKNLTKLRTSGREVRMTTISYIRRLLNRMAPGEMVTTRDCLNFGRRAAVDQALHRLVKTGFIKRLASGLFLKLSVAEHISQDASLIPSMTEIVKAKAKAFHRKIFVHGEHARERLQPPQRNGGEQVKEVFVFATDGATTSFKVLGKRVFLKRYALRKVALGDSRNALAIRALWWCGRDALTPAVVHDVFMALNSEERRLLRGQCAMMPSWMSDRVVFGHGSRRTVIPRSAYK